jgi:hypothetical protein
MDLLDILFTSFHGLTRYPLYIISWTCSISSLHHFMDVLDILFTSFPSPWNDVKRISSTFIKWCKEDIEQVHEMMSRGYPVSPWNNVKRISSKSMKWLLDFLFTSFHGLARYYLYIISWTCSISSLHHLASPWNDVKRISSTSMKWCKEDIEQVHEMM